MKNWKQNNFIKVPVTILTMLALSLCIFSGGFLIMGYDDGTFTSSSYEQSSACYSKMRNEMWNYADNISFAYNDLTKNDIENADENMDRIIKNIIHNTSSDISNMQVKITNEFDGVHFVDTFGEGEYYPSIDIIVEDILVTAALQKPLAIDDEYAGQAVMYYQKQSAFPIAWYAFIASTIVSIIGFAYIIITAGHRRNRDDITTGAVEKIPTDILLVLSVTIISLGIMGAYVTSRDAFYQQRDFAFSVAMITLCVLSLLVTSEIIIAIIASVAVRIKTNTFFSNTAIVWLFRKLKSCSIYAAKLIAVGLAKLPSIFRTVLIGLVVFAVNGILGMLCMSGFFGFMIFTLYNLAMLIAICMISWQMKLLQDGANRLASGNLTEKIDTSRMYFDCKIYGDTLNNISDAIGLAADEKYRSQRMKTELITNVSHDIKTPLTSIVTTVELLQKEHDKAQHKEYLEILQRQSMRMKKLVDDLVEASKASTGNIPVSLEKTDLVEIAEQAIAEYSAKFEQCNLTIIKKLPEQCHVMADGRLMWRVMDNLLSNVCKYAQSGTRVYISITEGDTAEISIKNISGTELNISADELMERFVRGDSSRSTEGSGLGLNIAQSLMQIQNGRLELYIDGDFFKVQLFI